MFFVHSYPPFLPLASETDRAMFVRDPPKPKPKKKEVKESDMISHPSHKQQPGEVCYEDYFFAHVYVEFLIAPGNDIWTR